MFAMERGRSPVDALSTASVINFPEQLHYVLDKMERDDLSHIASWQPHGRSFKVHQRDAFAEKILGRWFKQSKYSSFQRQLNIYNFKRVSSGPDKDSYYHDSFLWNQPLLSRKIQRMAVKGQGPRRPGSLTITPNLNANPLRPLAGIRATTSNSTATEVLGRTNDNQSTTVGGSAAVQTETKPGTGCTVEHSAFTRLTAPLVSARSVNSVTARSVNSVTARSVNSATTMVPRLGHGTSATLKPAEMRRSVHLVPGHETASVVLSDWQFLQVWSYHQEQRRQRQRLQELCLLVATAQNQAGDYWPLW